MNFKVKCIRGPFWLPDEPEFADNADEHFGYECIINDKHRIIIGEEPADEFRYVFEADKETYELYTKNKSTLVPLIAKAIKSFELKQKLSPSTKETFGDLIDEL